MTIRNEIEVAAGKPLLDMTRGELLAILGNVLAKLDSIDASCAAKIDQRRKKAKRLTPFKRAEAAE